MLVRPSLDLIEKLKLSLELLSVLRDEKFPGKWATIKLLWHEAGIT